LFASN